MASGLNPPVGPNLLGGPWPQPMASGLPQHRAWTSAGYLAQRRTLGQTDTSSPSTCESDNSCSRTVNSWRHAASRLNPRARRTHFMSSPIATCPIISTCCLKASLVVRIFASASKTRNSAHRTKPSGPASVGCGNRDTTTASCGRMRISRGTSITSSRTRFAPALSLVPLITPMHQRCFRGARPLGRAASARHHSALSAIMGSTRAARRAGT
jgi:hypothetical protein